MNDIVHKSAAAAQEFSRELQKKLSVLGLPLVLVRDSWVLEYS